MFFSTSFFVVVSFLASSAFSATIPSSGHNTVLVVDPAIKWDKGQIFYANGSLAMETKHIGKNITLVENGEIVSTLRRFHKPCENHTSVYDSNQIVFTLFWEGIYGLYAWTYQRSDVKETTFLWKPYSDSTLGVNTVEGIVSLKTDPTLQTHNAEIWAASPPKGFPPNLMPGVTTAWIITIYNDANSSIVAPQLFEMVELIYLLARRNAKCPHRSD
ncbi:hypothetical protein CROQUDRAFT_93233 [Cronartium quercuum f. sp. fusiforme G11]|uniref:Uncharacterized protein n=1 Tax=Cronartium quercuum f. sp. fusiforme G11 TaxID=708437 RepID=A0A9P6TB59_9BASI|nr:hypothetical protein CROQUDRAFT_93233 [Cronartium quercuum f. sp. fusiforme G11]